jgi:hypothetical protein
VGHTQASPTEGVREVIAAWGSMIVLLPLVLFAAYAVYWIVFRSGKER